ncbi:radical SAM/SPASM domain-containing protein [Sulfurimonas sp.]|uniref:radical SAM/SPASM domain-containing protein n=1 Tax=Sulfurimonas sp. TaxID=2022749 RepID=UPI0025FFE046|nr:radical SAM/SPASM domain-containing protein [Sulfurimonas sp.]MCK9455423.1 radical SAM protein [Sulfurimonas sp.]
MKKKVNFDICTFCNHKCTFCSNSDPRTIKEQTTLKDFDKVMRNVAKYVEISELGLSAKGEVLVNKEFARIIKSSKEDFKIPYVYFSTNGALLDEKRAIEILEAGVDSIKFSINAVDAKSYHSVHLVDDFDTVIKNFKNLLKLKRERFKTLKVTISSVIDLDKESLVESFKELIGKDFELVDDVAVYAITYTPKFNKVSSEQKVTKKCSIPFNELYINSDGSLGLCCKDYFDAVNFGSLLENDFMDVYNSKEFLEIREMHQKSLFPDNHLCKNCLLYGGE